VIAETGMNEHFVSEMAHTLPMSFAYSILFLVMGGGSNQLDVVLMKEVEKLNGQELAACVDVKFSKVLSKVVIIRWAVIDFENLELINDIERAQTSKTEEDTIAREGIDNDQVMFVICVAGDATGGGISDNITEEDCARFGGRGN
jgi:hypothetical protein